MFCEFGAHNGIFLCNTRELALNGCDGLYIEASPQYSKCKENYKDFKNIKVVREMVGEKTAMGGNTKVKEKSFDTICKKHFNKKLDLLVIDVDGGDYEIMRGIKKYLPKVLMIECNPFRNPLDETYYG